MDKVARTLARTAAKTCRQRGYNDFWSTSPNGHLMATIVGAAYQAQAMGLQPLDIQGREGRAAFEAIAIAATYPRRPTLDAEWNWAVNRAKRFLKEEERRKILKQRRRPCSKKRQRKQIRRIRRSVKSEVPV